MGKLTQTIKNFLAEPLTRGMAIDDPSTTDLRRRIVREKPFLRKIYQEWYDLVASAVPSGPEPALELGSGAGFLDEVIPNLITSEIFVCPGVDIVADAHQMPFDDATLRAIVMTDVLHHLPWPRKFFREAARCIKPGGAIAMTEPWVTPGSTWIYQHLHHEPFRPDATEWEFPATGPLSGANGALPWILFVRDRKQFEREFPQWTIETIQPFMPLRYLLSGGVSMRPLVPNFTYGFWKRFEHFIDADGERLAMFAKIVLRRN
jgi:SAM-dependent methyltransferase